MWQKCWSTNQSLVHNLRFRERGPLKSWRPETMAEAILSVLKEGLSLSQAARKYDIPYPTFVLYANRVHNMLGPSADGGSGKYLNYYFYLHVMRVAAQGCIRPILCSFSLVTSFAIDKAFENVCKNAPKNCEIRVKFRNW